MPASYLGRRRSRPVADAPALDGAEVAKAWLVELVAIAPLECAARLPGPRFAEDAPRLCAAVVAALSSDAALEDLEPGGTLAPLALGAGHLAGAPTALEAVSALDALRTVVWSALMEASDRPVPAQVADLADRLGTVIATLTTATLESPHPLGPTRPGDRGPLAVVLRESRPDEDPAGPTAVVDVAATPHDASARDDAGPRNAAVDPLRDDAPHDAGSEPQVETLRDDARPRDIAAGPRVEALRDDARPRDIAAGPRVEALRDDARPRDVGAEPLVETLRDDPRPRDIAAGPRIEALRDDASHDGAIRRDAAPEPQIEALRDDAPHDAAGPWVEDSGDGRRGADPETWRRESPSWEDERAPADDMAPSVADRGTPAADALAEIEAALREAAHAADPLAEAAARLRALDFDVEDPFTAAASRLRSEAAPVEEPRIRRLPEVEDATELSGVRATPWGASIERRLQRRRSDDRPFAVLCLEIVDADRLVAADIERDVSDTLEAAEAAILAQLRPADALIRERPGRYWLTTPDTDASDAHALAHRIAAAVESLPPHRGAPLQVAIGATTCPTDGDDATALENAAEEALFAARAGGLRVAGPPSAE